MLDANEPFRREAVIDLSEVRLEKVYADGKREDIPWPKDWPTGYVDGSFLRAQGYRVVFP